MIRAGSLPERLANPIPGWDSPRVSFQGQNGKADFSVHYMLKPVENLPSIFSKPSRIKHLVFHRPTKFGA